MKTAFLLVALNILTMFWERFNAIHSANQLRREVQVYFEKKEYGSAAKSLELLLYTRKENDDLLRLNLALCYEKLHRYSESKSLFQQLSSSPNQTIRAQAYLHLGVMLAGSKKDNALQYFRLALKADPSNEEARFNYELLRKMDPLQMPESQKEEKDSGENSQLMTTENRPQGNKNDENKSTNSDAPARQGSDFQIDDAGNKKGDALQSERLNTLNLTEQQARMLLENLKNNEIQHVQQLRKTTKHSTTYKGPEY